jgi:thiamine biosynthesis lipoprotein
LPVLALMAAALSVGVLWLRPPVRAEAEFLVFGSRARIDLRTGDKEQADAALSGIGRLLAHNHRTWHAWEPSELTRLNEDLNAGRARQVPADLAAMIREAQRGYMLSDGLFNPAAGKLIGAWGFHTSDYPVRSPSPTVEQITPLLAAAPAMTDILVADDGTVSTRNPAVSLDLNGLAEGFAARQIHELLARQGIHDALIYIGGFVLALGQDEKQRPWRVGIRAPNGGILGVVDLNDGEALSSSGDYQRRRADTEAQGHILDTRTGRPQRAAAAASVISRDPVLADMAATALMVAGPDGFDTLSARMGLRCALLASHDGSLHITSALQARLRLTEQSPASIRVHHVAGTGC